MTRSPRHPARRACPRLSPRRQALWAPLAPPRPAPKPGRRSDCAAEGSTGHARAACRQPPPLRRPKGPPWLCARSGVRCLLGGSPAHRLPRTREACSVLTQLVREETLRKGGRVPESRRGASGKRACPEDKCNCPALALPEPPSPGGQPITSAGCETERLTRPGRFERPTSRSGGCGSPGQGWES